MLRRRRDRRGRGLRGPLGPSALPLVRTRAERFDELVLDAVERLEGRWDDELRGVEFAVEEVPVPEPGREAAGRVPLGRSLPRSGALPARVVVYRRPVENRAADQRELAQLVHEVVVEQFADLLGVDPQTVDPEYGDAEDED